MTAQYDDIDEQRIEQAKARRARLASAQVYELDPDNLPPDNSGAVSDWGSDLQYEALTYGVPEPVYLPVLGQPGFLRRGFVHLLTAAPKAGKTELLLQSIADWEHEREVVYYFTEEYRDLWLERLDVMYQRGHTYEHVKFFYLPRLAPDKRLAFITERISDAAPTVVIVDTIRSGLTIEDESDNPAIRKALEPLTTAAHGAEKTVVLVHHTSKAMARSSKIIASAGGLDFLGAVDAVLNLTTKPKAQITDTARVLIGAGRMRFGGDLTYHWPDREGPLVVLPQATDVPDIMDYEWMRTQETGTTMERLRALHAAGLVDCSLDPAKNNQGKVYLWRRHMEDELE